MLCRKTLEYRQLTDDEIRNDPRFFLRSMFKLHIIDPTDDTKRRYKCMLCLPRENLIWTARSTNQHLLKHVKHAHSENAYKKLVAMLDERPKNKKRPRSPPPSSESSQSQQHSVSRNKKGGRLVTPLHLMVYSQRDFEVDTITEIVMDNLPFEVCNQQMLTLLGLALFWTPHMAAFLIFGTYKPVPTVGPKIHWPPYESSISHKFCSLGC
jgi:hypothetical protein